MAEKSIPEFDDATLMEKLAEVLETWPLYRELKYRGTSNKLFPTVIRLTCPVCHGQRNWSHITGTSGTGMGAPPPPTPIVRGVVRQATEESPYREARFRCRDCGKATVAYFFMWFSHATAEHPATFAKVGQSPALEHHPPQEVARNLDKQDAEFYRKALTSRNFGFGVGALAYLRRIVENRMNDLLDLIREAAEQDGEVPDELQRIEEVKKSWRFDDKIGYAAKALPSHLKNKGGENPLDFLHDLASEGLHYRDDDDCIEIFDRCKTAFEYIFRRLRVEIDDAKAYIASVKASSTEKSETS